MLYNLLSLRIPLSDSPDFYRSFYSQYNLLQINDIIIRELLGRCGANELEQIESWISTDGEDFSNAEELLFILGLRDGALELRKQDNRGLDFSAFRELQRTSLNPVLWYTITNEFLSLYGLFEQALKDFLLLCGEDAGKSKERSLIPHFFNALGENRKTFLAILGQNTSGILETQNELTVVWQYFTEQRNAFAHAGGHITPRFRENMERLGKTIGPELAAIEAKKSFLFRC